MLRTGLMLALAGLLSSGCTLVTDFEDCSTDSECPSGACVDGLCEGAASCEVHTDCRAGGDSSSYCIAGSCATVDESLCTVDPRLEDADTPLLHFGMLMPFTGRNQSKGEANRDGVVVALKQLNQAQGGVAGRDLSLITCDTLSDPVQAQTAAEHLVNDLGISVVIGALLSDATIDVAQNVTIEAEALLVSPASTSPIITGLDDSGLVWRTVPSDELQGQALGELAAGAAGEPIAVLFSDNNYGNGLFNEMQSTINKIDSSTLEDSRFQTLSYEVDQGELQTEAFLTRAQTLFGDEGYRPTRIFVLGSAESQQIIRSIDETYFGSLPDAERPIWVLTDGGRDPGLFDMSFSDVWSRITGTSPQEVRTPVTAAFETRYEAESTIEIENAPFADNSYDAAILASLVVASAADPLSPTASELATGMTLVSSGDPYTANDSFADAANAIAAGTSVDYVGASGDVNFDPATGDVSSPIEGWRINDTGDGFESTGILVTP